MSLPLVSVIVPTLPSRAAFEPLWRECLAAQDYPQDLIEICVDRTAQKFNVTSKRNRLIYMANGEFIFIQDDDDISLPWRIRLQVEAFLKNPDKQVVGSGLYHKFDLQTGEGEKHQTANVKCCSIAFRKEAWRQHKLNEYTYPGKLGGAEPCGTCHFVGHYHAETVNLNHPILVQTVHTQNISGTHLSSSLPDATDEVRALVGEDLLSRFRKAAATLRTR